MQSIKLPKDISSKILTVGPDYRSSRGGVSAVIEVYSRNFEVFNFISSYKDKFKFFVFVRCLFKLLIVLTINHEIKIIHIHAASYGSFYRKFIISIIGKKIFGKKIVYHIHGGGFQAFYSKGNKLLRLSIQKLFSIVDAVICLSHSWYDYYNLNFKIKKLVILPNIIDYPEKINSRANTFDTIHLLFLGLICKNKGIFDLLNVIANKKEHYKNKIKLSVGGNGETQFLQEIIKKNQLEGIVEFMGWVEGKVKNELLNNSDIFILPSYKEGLPISILEAMSYGKAIIASKVGGIPEIVFENKNGVLIEAGNLAQIEKALDNFIKNRELIIKYGTASKQLAQEYLPDSVLIKLTSLYKSLLEYE